MTDTTQNVAPEAAAEPVTVTAENVDALMQEQKSADAPEPEHHEEKKEEPKVNLGALHEERARRKALEAEKRNLSQQLEEQRAWRAQNEAILQERLSALQQRQPIDPNENPVGYLAEQQQYTQKTLEAMLQKQQAEQEQQQRITTLQQFTNHIQRTEADFSKEKPDYMEAVAFAKNFKAREYATFGYSPEEAQVMVNNDALAIAQRALQVGGNPAEFAYQYALTVGYRPSVGAEQKLNMMEAGQKAAKPSSGGGKNTGSVTLEQLVSMSPAEFEKATAGDAFKKLMGG